MTAEVVATPDGTRSLLSALNDKIEEALAEYDMTNVASVEVSSWVEDVDRIADAPVVNVVNIAPPAEAAD